MLVSSDTNQTHKAMITFSLFLSEHFEHSVYLTSFPFFSSILKFNLYAFVHLVYRFKYVVVSIIPIMDFRIKNFYILCLVHGVVFIRYARFNVCHMHPLFLSTRVDGNKNMWECLWNIINTE